MTSPSQHGVARFNSSVARVLHVCTWTVMTILLVGLALQIMHDASPGVPTINAQKFSPVADHLRSARELLQSLAEYRTDPSSWVQLGVISLLCVPVVRVLFVFILAAKHKRVALSLTSAVVLVGLLYAWW